MSESNVVVFAFISAYAWTRAIMNIYLIGFMAAGKSTIGPHLAACLEWRFVDSDDELERSTGKTISSIVQNEGESAFRVYESDVLKKLAEGDQQVIAVGGGAPTIDRNWAHFHRGITVYLDVEADTLIERLKHEKRPLLDGLNEAERSIKIRQMLEQRKLFYQRANLQIEAESEPEQVAKEIQKQVVSCRL